MRVIYLNAQHLPSTEVDSQQVVKTVSALAAEGADIELTVPHPWSWRRRSESELEEQVMRYYSVRHPFKLRPVPTIMRTPGEVERGVAADLVVVGVRGEGGIGSMIMGSVATYLVHHLPGAIAVVPGSDG